MNEQYKDELFAELAGKSPAQRAALIEQLELTSAERDEIENMGKTADALWTAAHAAPPLENDRTAALLGLIADPSETLSKQRLVQLRKRARITIDELAKKLSQRGWQVSTKQVFSWERGNTEEVPPALIQAISEVLGVPVNQLVEKHEISSAKQSQLQQLRAHPAFENLAQRWALLKNVPYEIAESMLRMRVATTVHRGEIPDLEQSLASLEELLTSLEAPGGE